MTEAGYRGRPSLMSQPLLRPLGSKRQKELRAAEIEGVGVRRRSYPEPPRPGLIPDTRNLLETWPREHRLLHCALLRCPLPGGVPRRHITREASVSSNAGASSFWQPWPVAPESEPRGRV